MEDDAVIMHEPLLGHAEAEVLEKESGAQAAWRHRLLLGTLAFTDLTANMAISAVYPFLPQQLESAGAGPYQRGVVFAALPLGVLLLSPAVPPLLWRVGVLPILTTSIALLAACLVLSSFARPFADDVPGGASVLTSVAMWASARLVMGRGLHSSTSQLNLSRVRHKKTLYIP
jgi:MFS family permease